MAACLIGILVSDPLYSGDFPIVEVEGHAILGDELENNQPTNHFQRRRCPDMSKSLSTTLIGVAVVLVVIGLLNHLPCT